MRQAYDDTSPCTRCGSSIEDCDCCAEYELRSSMRSLGIQASYPMDGTTNGYYDPYYYNRRQPDFATMNNDLATLNRMLREFGY